MRVFLAQREFIAAHADFDRVPHRRDLDQSHFGAWDQPHVQKPQPQRAFAGDRADGARLTDL